MKTRGFLRHIGCLGGRMCYWPLLVVLSVLLSQCAPDGDTGRLTAPTSSSPQSERQAVQNLLDLYSTAILHEDSDRLQALFPLAQEHPLGEGQQFGMAMTAVFRSGAITNLQIEALEISADLRTVSFL